ncbi:MAG: hypothetical protein OXN89_01265 [Bryobacterales bacterium]|nr:hypothetical protein [Bryobacterales bacterium]
MKVKLKLVQVPNARVPQDVQHEMDRIIPAASVRVPPSRAPKQTAEDEIRRSTLNTDFHGANRA